MLSYNIDIAVQHICQADNRMADLVAAAGDFRLDYVPILSPFESLAESIIYQQISGKAAATIHARFLDLFPDKAHPSPQDILDTDESVLRSAGVSGNKAKAIYSLAEKTIEGLVPLKMEDLEGLSNEEIKQNLIQVRGIGAWTVEMMLMFNLGRPDVFPVTDYGVQNGYRLWYGQEDLPKPKAFMQYAAKFAPYRSVAAWYLWRAVDLHKIGAF